MSAPKTGAARQRRAEDAWALAITLALAGIVVAVAAIPVGLLAGRTPGFIMLFVAAGLAFLSLVPVPVFLRAWNR